jgi:radical SAM superfamily enzyme YgiQ (UPF0313 family)
MTLFYVFGLPGSSTVTVERTFELVKESGYKFNFSVCIPYPGSPLWNEMQEDLDKISWDRYDEGDVNDPLYVPEGMTQDELTALVQRANQLASVE